MKLEWHCSNIDATLFNTVLSGRCSLPDNGIEMSTPGDEMLNFIFIHLHLTVQVNML